MTDLEKQMLAALKEQRMFLQNLLAVGDCTESVDVVEDMIAKLLALLNKATAAETLEAKSE